MHKLNYHFLLGSRTINQQQFEFYVFIVRFKQFASCEKFKKKRAKMLSGENNFVERERKSRFGGKILIAFPPAFPFILHSERKTLAGRKNNKLLMKRIQLSVSC